MDIIEILERCDTIGEVAIAIKGYSNGKSNKLAKNYIIEYKYEYKFLSSLEEKYHKNPKICKNCNEIIPFDKKYNEFCSSNCSTSYNNKIRGSHSEKTKEKISFSLKGKIKDKNISKTLKEYKRTCLYCNSDFKVKRNNGRLSKAKYCSDECSNLAMKLNVSLSQKDRVEKGIHKGWQSRNILSYPEEFFIKVLDNNNLKYEPNFMIKKSDLGIKDSGNYFLDFYFRDKNIDLEIDGKQHNYDDRQESDNVRDKLLKKYGIFVYRIKWKNINNIEGKNYIESEIKKFIEFYNEYEFIFKKKT